METLKKWLKFILDFTTGLGFYGIGLLGLALAFWFLFSGQFWTNLGTGFMGAFVFKNYAAIIAYIRSFLDKN